MFDLMLLFSYLPENQTQMKNHYKQKHKITVRKKHITLESCLSDSEKVHVREGCLKKATLF